MSPRLYLGLQAHTPGSASGSRGLSLLRLGGSTVLHVNLEQCGLNNTPPITMSLSLKVSFCMLFYSPVAIAVIY